MRGRRRHRFLNDLRTTMTQEPHDTADQDERSGGEPHCERRSVPSTSVWKGTAETRWLFQIDGLHTHRGVKRGSLDDESRLETMDQHIDR